MPQEIRKEYDYMEAKINATEGLNNE